MKSVVVTGVSTGIGYASVGVLVKRGFHVFGSVRRKADADRLSNEWKINFTPLIFDVTDAAAIAKAADEVRAHLSGQKLAGLVNNAGIAVAGPLLHLSAEEMRQQLEINLVGQLVVTQAFAPLLGTDRSLQGAPGRIVMISSVSGKSGSPFVGAYAASKHGLEGMSESLRRELLPYGIDVIIIGPGAVRTPIWDKATALDISRFGNTIYAPALEQVMGYMATQGAKGIPAHTLGKLVHKALTAAHPKTRYQITRNPIQGWLLRNLPIRRVDRMIAKRLGLSKL